MGFPGSSAGKESACNAGDPDAIPGSGRSPGEGIDPLPTPVLLSFLGGSAGKESACNAGDLGLIPGLVRFPWRREWQPTLVLLLGEFRGQRTFEVFSPWCRKESDTIEELNTLTFLENLA